MNLATITDPSHSLAGVVWDKPWLVMSLPHQSWYCSQLYLPWGTAGPCCTLTLRDLTLKHYYSSACLKYHFQPEPYLQPNHTHSPSCPKMHPLKIPRQKLSFAIKPACNIRLQLCLWHLLQAESHSCSCASSYWMLASPDPEALRSC